MTAGARKGVHAMFDGARKGFTRLEVALGLCVVAAVLVVTLPGLWRGNGQDRQRNARSRAEEIAAAVLDYRCDTGRWPDATGGLLDVACLTEKPVPTDDAVTQAAAGSVRSADGTRPGPVRSDPWLDEIPLDPWGRPYRVHLVGSAVAAAVASDAAGYPAAPPAGVGILVLSAGPDGVFQTDPGAAAGGFAADDVGFYLVNPGSGGR